MSVFSESASLLTEHLGYPPIALVDDVINAVNEILFKCTGAINAFLSKTYTPQRCKKYQIPEDEVSKGTEKLEAMLEDAVDRNFDKFEIYVFRNLLTVPQDLLAEGWIRLKHHRGVDFSQNDDNSMLDKRIAELEQQLLVEAQTNVRYRSRLERIELCLSAVEQYHQKVGFIVAESNENLKELGTSVESVVAPLVGQTTELLERVESLQDELADDPVQMPPTLRTRDRYLDAAARAILEQAGVDRYQDTVTEEEAEQAVAAANRLLQQ